MNHLKTSNSEANQRGRLVLIFLIVTYILSAGHMKDMRNLRRNSDSGTKTNMKKKC
jgi:hypothetical protein